MHFGHAGSALWDKLDDGVCELHHPPKTGAAFFGLRSRFFFTARSSHGNTRVAEFALRRLEDHQCLVLETLTRRQKLAVWKATFFTENDVRKLESPPYDLSRTTVFDATREEYPSAGDLSNKRAPSSYRRYQEDFERAEAETSEHPRIEKSGNDQEDPE